MPRPENGDSSDINKIFPDGIPEAIILLRDSRDRGGLPLEQISPDTVQVIGEDTIGKLQKDYLVDNKARQEFVRDTNWEAPPYYRAAVQAAEVCYSFLTGDEFIPFATALKSWAKGRYFSNPSAAHDVEIGSAIVLNAFLKESDQEFLNDLKERMEGEWVDGFNRTTIQGDEFGSALERGRHGLFIPGHQIHLRNFVDNLTMTSIQPEAHVDPMRLGAVGMYRAIEHVLMKREAVPPALP